MVNPNIKRTQLVTTLQLNTASSPSSSIKFYSTGDFTTDASTKNPPTESVSQHSTDKFKEFKEISSGTEGHDAKQLNLTFTYTCPYILSVNFRAYRFPFVCFSIVDD